jgi:hyperosmotically inducible protein
MKSNSLWRGTKWLALATVVAVSACASDNRSSTGQGPVAKVGEVLDDSLITTKVKSAFVADKDVSAMDISVSTNNGVVSLSGKGSADEARKAAQIASNVSGVKSVQNNIRQ